MWRACANCGKVHSQLRAIAEIAPAIRRRHYILVSVSGQRLDRKDNQNVVLSLRERNGLSPAGWAKGPAMPQQRNDYVTFSLGAWGRGSAMPQ